MTRLEINKWDKYNRLTIIKEVSPNIEYDWRKKRKFLCQCECWNIKRIKLVLLRNWETKSCWCIRWKQKKHWMTWTRIYNIWKWIKSRCNFKWWLQYKDWWWRWIIYDWMWEKFENFYEDMGPTYKEWLTIDRVNNDWNYCKNNCIWTTQKEQCRNTRKNRLITFKWKTKTVAEWSEITGIYNMTIYYRLNQWWPVEKILFYKK